MAERTSTPLVPEDRGDGGVTLRDGLKLLAPGGLFVPDQNTLVVADLHAGYTPTLRSRGYAVPAAADDALLSRLTGMIARSGARRVVVAGDLLHGRASVRPRRGAAGDASPLDELRNALGACELTVVVGNHDRRSIPALEARGLHAVLSLRVGVHEIDHGDDPARVRELRANSLARGGRLIIGHLHPALALDDGAGAHAVVPAFVTCAGLVCLPALSPWSRGLDVRGGVIRRQLAERVDASEPMGAAIVVGERVMVVGDVFGPEKTRTRA